MDREHFPCHDTVINARDTGGRFSFASAEAPGTDCAFKGHAPCRDEEDTADSVDLVNEAGLIDSKEDVGDQKIDDDSVDLVNVAGLIDSDEDVGEQRIAREGRIYGPQASEHVMHGQEFIAD